jgi:predicted MPP superfamily phosphohydrolase
MKLLILHLSDIHFEKNGDVSGKNTEGIIRALKTIDTFSYVIVVISGDIAYSGKVSQYNTAYKFFSNLKNRIKQEFDIGMVEFIVVPGNHDIDYDKGSLGHSELEEIFRQNSQDLKLADESKKMNAFYNHANGLQCFHDKSRFVCTRDIVIDKNILHFNLINTAAFSSLEEDQGFHYLSSVDMNILSEEKKSDYVLQSCIIRITGLII